MELRNKVFSTLTEYEQYIQAGVYPKPNVSYIEETDGVNWQPEIPEKYVLKYKRTDNTTWDLLLNRYVTGQFKVWDTDSAVTAINHYYDAADGYCKLELSGQPQIIPYGLMRPVDHTSEAFKIEEIILPEGITQIRNEAFPFQFSNPSLHYVDHPYLEFPSTLQQIEHTSFGSNVALTIKFKGTTIPQPVEGMMNWDDMTGREVWDCYPISWSDCWALNANPEMLTFLVPQASYDEWQSLGIYNVNIVAY